MDNIVGEFIVEQVNDPVWKPDFEEYNDIEDELDFYPKKFAG